MDARSTINVCGMSDHIILIREINKAAIQASMLKHANTEPREQFKAAVSHSDSKRRSFSFCLYIIKVLGGNLYKISSI